MPVTPLYFVGNPTPYYIVLSGADTKQLILTMGKVKTNNPKY